MLGQESIPNIYQDFAQIPWVTSSLIQAISDETWPTVFKNKMELAVGDVVHEYTSLEDE